MNAACAVSSRYIRRNGYVNGFSPRPIRIGAVERAKWGRALRWATAALIVVSLSAAWSERETDKRLAGIKQNANDGRRERVIAVELSKVVPDGTAAELQQYLTSRAMARPKPRVPGLCSTTARRRPVRVGRRLERGNIMETEEKKETSYRGCGGGARCGWQRRSGSCSCSS